MSVPLDRLYNFLHDISDRALLIYRWMPHGSKKLADLKPLHSITGPQWSDRNMPAMICHDQEPLFYDLYTESDIRDQMFVILENIPDTDVGNRKNILSLLDVVPKLHLRGLVYLEKQCAYDKILILHSEKRSDELKKYQSNDYLGVYYWSHAMIAADWFRYAEQDPKLIVDFSCIQKDFLIYNRAWTDTREYRLTFMQQLVRQQLQSYCLTSFAELDNGCNYLDHKFKNADLAVELDGLSGHFPTNKHNSTASADYNNDDYACTAIEVVLETLFDDNRLHLTEKTLRPIACGRPFILMATHGSLQYLKDYGFQTFDGLIDETYDTIVDPKERLQAVIKEMSRIAALSHTEKHILWSEIYKISKFNQRLFFSKNWRQSIVEEFLCNLSRSVSMLDQYKNKAIQRQLDLIWINNHYVPESTMIL